MYRIGIIGTENTHALAFAKYFNLPDPETGKRPHEDVRVVAILGADQEANKQIIEQAGVEFVAEKVEDFFGRVDGMMITCRRGSEHMAYALPFAERKIPLFVDKPFTSDPKEADALLAAIKKYDCPVQGGSGCKYVSAVQEIKALVAELREKGEFVSAAMSFQVMLNSIYDGIYFYAPHLVEMCLEAFGMDVKAVQTMRTGDSLQVNVQYENDAVSLHFVAAGKPGCIVFGKKQNYHFDIDITGLYEIEADHYAKLLKGEYDSLPDEKLIKPVHMIDAIKRSMETEEIVKL